MATQEARTPMRKDNMIGHSEDLLLIESIRWADSGFIKISIDYDTITISFQESTHIQVNLISYGYIGFQSVGIWDESILESCSIADTHEFLSHCINVLQKRMGTDWGETGSPDRNKRSWRLLQIKFSDDAEILIPFTRLELTREPYKRNS